MSDTNIHSTNRTEKLIGKVKISGSLEVLTGMRIGGSKSTLEIGGVDLNVIKTPADVPYIPGSSLKGKLRSLLAREEGSPSWDKDSKTIKAIFGDAGKDQDSGELGRLIVRDAFLDETHFKEEFEGKNLDLAYTEVKTENSIDRLTGTTGSRGGGMRHPERVPAGARFDFVMIFDMKVAPDEEVNAEMKANELKALFIHASKKEPLPDRHNKALLEYLLKAMRLLEDDYLGGQGTRGYGQICFRKVDFEYKTLREYESGEDWKKLDSNYYSFRPEADAGGVHKTGEAS